MKNLTIQDAATAWAAEKRAFIKISSFSTYCLILHTHILPVFGHKTSLREKEVQQFILDKVKAGYRHKYVRDIIAVLKMINGQLCRMQKVPVPVPAWTLKYPAENQPGLRPVLAAEEQDRLLHYLRNHLNYKNLGLYIALSTGMRIGELCALQWKDIDLSRNVIQVRKTLLRIYRVDETPRRTELMIGPPKSAGSQREIPIHQDLAQRLKALSASTAPDHFILSNARRPVEMRSYRNWFDSVLREVGIQHMKFHSLRHTFATRCINSDCDYKTVSALLGHADISTTLDLYVHPDLERKRKCIEKAFLQFF